MRDGTVVFNRKHNGSKERFVGMLEDELDNLIDDIASGVAVDFRARLRNPS
jgi:hypothetical protein